jgi:hypothetical protein
MRQFEKTTLFNLKYGDRFYYLNDKTKRVYEVTSKKEKSITIKADDDFRENKIKADRKVVFLRNSLVKENAE